MLSVLLIVAAHMLLTSRRAPYRDAFGLFFLVDLCLLAYFYLGPLTTPETIEQFSRLSHQVVVILGIAALYAGMHLGIAGKPKGPMADVFSAPADDLKLAWCWFAWYLVLWIIYVAVNSDGMSLGAYMGRGRVEEYLTGKVVEGNTLGILREFGGAGVLLLMVRLAQQKKYWTAGVVFGLFLFCAVVIAHTRLGVLLFLSLPIVYWHYCRRRIPKVALIIGIVPFVYVMSILNVLRTDGTFEDVDFSFSPTETVDRMQDDLSILKGLDYIIELHLSEALPYEHGLSYWHILLTPIPRAVWQQKPFVSFQARWTEKYLSRQLGSGTRVPVWNFTVWGEGLAEFGLCGVAVGLFAYGWFAATIYKYLLLSPHWVCVRFLFCAIAATYLRGTLGDIVIWTLYFLGPLTLSLLAIGAGEHRRRGASVPMPTYGAETGWQT